MAVRRIAALALAAAVLIAAPAQAKLRTFHLRYGPVAMGGFNVKYPRGLIQAPHVTGNIVRMHAQLVTAGGRRVTIRDVMLHHIVFHRYRKSNITGQCTSRRMEPFYGTGEENESLRLPKGYGYPIRATDRWHMASMLMSHSERLMNVYIEYTVTVDTTSRLTPVKAFWVRANGCNHGIGYGVAGGGAPGATDTHTFNWKVPINGRIVAAGGHLHGGAEDMWVSQPRCQNRRLLDNTPAWGEPNALVYRARPVLHEPGPTDTRWFSSARGIAVRKGETLRLNAVYDATMPHTVMSITHLYIAPPRKGAATGCARLPADRQEIRKPLRYRFQPPLVTVPLNGVDDSGHTFVINNPGWPVKPVQSGAIIDIGPNGYSPEAVELPLGGSLTWRVKGSIEHNVRFANGPRLITTVSLHNGETATREFVRPGHYELFCSLHPVTMHQIVEVR
jgi:plastocyanin